MAQVIDFTSAQVAKGVHAYIPQLKQQKPDCQLEASFAYGGGYRVVSPIDLKGRGIKHYQSRGNRRIYYLTALAFEKLKEHHSISIECSLD